jgi:ActR/RegA family two-component response regulator
MSDEMPLSGCAVLILEDDYYLAEDAREALEQAGADVLGPYSRVEEALGSLEKDLPQYAVLDLNLGAGPNFEVVRTLKMQGVPTLLVTGYDAHIIPADLASTPCLQKPISMADLVSAVTRLRG